MWCCREKLRYFEAKNERQLWIGKIPDRPSVTCTACYPILQLSFSTEMVEGGHDCDKLHTALLRFEMCFPEIVGCHKAVLPPPKYDLNGVNVTLQINKNWQLFPQ
jgi:hypothetical protein